MASFDFYPVNHLSEHPTVDVQITCVGAGVNVGILNFIKDGLSAGKRRQPDSRC